MFGWSAGDGNLDHSNATIFREALGCYCFCSWGGVAKGGGERRLAMCYRAWFPHFGFLERRLKNRPPP